MSDSIQPSLRILSDYQLIRKYRLLQKIPFSKSTLHAKLDRKSRYHDATFPRPIYFPGSRIPYWNEESVNAWIAAASSGALDATMPVLAPSLASPSAARSATTSKKAAK